MSDELRDELLRVKARESRYKKEAEEKIARLESALREALNAKKNEELQAEQLRVAEDKIRLAEDMVRHSKNDGAALHDKIVAIKDFIVDSADIKKIFKSALCLQIKNIKNILNDINSQSNNQIDVLLDILNKDRNFIKKYLVWYEKSSPS